MSTTESARHEMLVALQGAIGKEAAMTLADHLPPTGWADVARRHDIDQLERRLDLRFESIDHRFEALEHRMDTFEHRFDALGHRFESLEHRIDARVGTASADLRSEMLTMHRQLFFAILGAFVANAGVTIAAVQLSS